jgi:hypothetical protein
MHDGRAGDMRQHSRLGVDLPQQLAIVRVDGVGVSLPIPEIRGEFRAAASGDGADSSTDQGLCAARPCRVVGEGRRLPGSPSARIAQISLRRDAAHPGPRAAGGQTPGGSCRRSPQDRNSGQARRAFAFRRNVPRHPGSPRASRCSTYKKPLKRTRRCKPPPRPVPWPLNATLPSDFRAVSGRSLESRRKRQDDRLRQATSYG